MIKPYHSIYDLGGATRSILISGSRIVVHVPLMVREGLQGGTRLGQLSVFLHRKIYSQLQILFFGFC